MTYDELLDWIENEASLGMAEGDTRNALNAIKWKIKDCKAATAVAPIPSSAGRDDEDGLFSKTYPLLIEHYQRVARNLANLWSNGNDGARTGILAALLLAASGETL